jgi:C_GCAxxG_C_C family probable redox protein
MLDIRPAGPEDLGAIKVLLAVCLLPALKVDDANCAFFVAESERGIIGVCCIEPCGGAVALLRLLGVMPGYRKQQIGRRLVHSAMNHAEESGLNHLYLLTDAAKNYFQSIGFSLLEKKDAPSELSQSKLYLQHIRTNTQLMFRHLRSGLADHRAPAEPKVASRAKAHFDAGYHCAESVLLAAADHAGIHSPLIPAIATGFNHGTAHTWGTCGALNGAILALNLTHGRSSPDQPIADNYAAVRKLIDAFGKACGSTLCSELMGCDLDTRDGQHAYQNNRQRSQCRELVGIAAGLVAQLIDAHRKAEGDAEAEKVSNAA